MACSCSLRLDEQLTRIGIRGFVCCPHLVSNRSHQTGRYCGRRHSRKHWYRSSCESKPCPKDRGQPRAHIANILIWLQHVCRSKGYNLVIYMPNVCLSCLMNSGRRMGSLTRFGSRADPKSREDRPPAHAWC